MHSRVSKIVKIAVMVLVLHQFSMVSGFKCPDGVKGAKADQTTVKCVAVSKKQATQLLLINPTTTGGESTCIAGQKEACVDSTLANSRKVDEETFKQHGTQSDTLVPATAGPGGSTSGAATTSTTKKEDPKK